MRLPDFYYDIMNNAVMVSGIYRSGTSLLGKIIGSLKKFEYEFEPPLINYFNALVKNNNEFNEKIMIDIITNYFVEDIMINYLHGRKYNFRYQDDSCIFNMKSYSEVMDRMNNINNSADAIDLFKKNKFRFSFKSPSTYKIIPLFFDNFNHFKLIDITRNLGSIIGSWKKKNWLSYKDREINYYNNLSPFHDNKEVPLPYYVDSDKIDLWKNGDEIDRILECVISIVQNKLRILELIKNKYPKRILEIKYEELIDNSQEKVKNIVVFLNAETTSKTDKNINKIRNKTTEYDLETLLQQCDKDVYDKLIYYNRKLGYKKLK